MSDTCVDAVVPAFATPRTVAGETLEVPLALILAHQWAPGVPLARIHAAFIATSAHFGLVQLFKLPPFTLSSGNHCEELATTPLDNVKYYNTLNSYSTSGSRCDAWSPMTVKLVDKEFMVVDGPVVVVVHCSYNGIGIRSDSGSSSSGS